MPNLQNRLLHRILGIVAAFVILHLLILHSQAIFFQYPLEYRENTDLLRAYLLSTGQNVYAYENLPSAHSQYGFLYPWLGSKLFRFTGIHYYPLRLITALAILPVLGLFIWQGVKNKLGPLDLFLLCGIVYASYLINAGNMQAMPNALVLALFSLAVLVPPLLRFNKISLAASCILSALVDWARKNNLHWHIEHDIFVAKT